MPLDNSVTIEDLVKQRQDSRAEAEPDKPTDETDETSVLPDEDIEQDIENLEEDIDEPEGSDEPVDKPDSDELYVTIDDEELSFSQIRELQQGNLRQSDYTRKTQAVAEDRKRLDSDREVFNTKSSTLDGFIDQLSVMVEGFETKDFDGYTLDELRENDPGEYIKQTELQKSRESKLREIKDSRLNDSALKQQDSANQQLQILSDKNGWLENGKPTKAYKKDTETVKAYLDHLGMSEAEQKCIFISGHGQVYIDQAKSFSKSKTNSATMKKVRKAPVITKPGGVQTSSQQNELEIAKANHKKYGSVDTGVALRKAVRNAKN